MRLLVRGGLVILAVTEFGVGVWAQFFPELFYRDFPTVDLTPPFSEHLMRDYGGATLGLTVFLVAGAIWLDRRIVMLALVAYLVFALPHAAFHLMHLEGASPADSWFLAISLGGLVALAITVLAVAPRALAPSQRQNG